MNAINLCDGNNNYTNNADVWNKNMNFYSDTYSQNYINTQNLWRLK